MIDFIMIEIEDPDSDLAEGHGCRPFVVAPAVGDVIVIDDETYRGVFFKVIARVLASPPTNAAGDLYVRRTENRFD